MRCPQWLRSDFHRHLRLLLCMVLALALVRYVLTCTDMSTWTSWVFNKPFYNSRHKMPQLFNESTSGTKNTESSTQPKVTIALWQLFSKVVLASSFASTVPNDFTTATTVTTTTTASLTSPPLRIPEMYICSAYLGTGQLGNSMFEYISSYVTAMRLGLKFFVLPDGKQPQAYQQMSSLFNITAPLYSGNFSADRSVSEKGWGIYTPDVAKLESYGTYTQIIGWLQSWRYIEGCEQFVRKEFGLTDRYQLFVNDFFTKNGIHRTAGDQKRATLIAVHVRRGDMLAHLDQYQMASPQYLVQAIAYFRTKYADQQPAFVVATDDKSWTPAIVDSLQQNYSVPVIYTNGTAEEDMAVLSSCDHAIITGGTYGWWAAWLTGGNVMYFRDFMWNGSIEWSNYNAEDYYPPSWIGGS